MRVDESTLLWLVLVITLLFLGAVFLGRLFDIVGQMTWRDILRIMFNGRRGF